MLPIVSTLAVGLMIMALVLGYRGDARLIGQEADPPGTLPRDRETVISYVALGDSTVAGVGASSREATYVAHLFANLQAIYPKAQVHNLGVPGATASDVLSGQLPRATDLQPRLVTLSVGPNDITRGRTNEQYAADVDRIFSTLRADSRTVLVVNLLPDLSLAPVFRPEQRPTIAARTAELNAVLLQLGEAHGAVMVDLFSASQAEVPFAAEYVSADGYHPSDAGYARWADIMWQALDPYIAPPADPLFQLFRPIRLAAPLIRNRSDVHEFLR